MKKLYLLFFLLIAFWGNAQVLYDDYPWTGNQARSSFNGGKWPYTNLKYYFVNGSTHLSNTAAYNAVRDAFYIWEERSTLTFTEVFSASQANIKISWAKGDHGDGSPFDGNSSGTSGPNVLAHTFSPPPAGGTRAGELHFDDDENWTTGGMFGIDLTTVAIHELGHALGLDHSDVTPSIMQKSYVVADHNLYEDDLQAIWKLYGRPYPIKGSTAVLAPASTTYTIGNTLPPGATVTWKAYPANSATIKSGQGTGTVTFSVTSNAFLGVDATINFRSGRRWVCDRLSVAASIMPVISNIEVFKYQQGPGEYSLKAIVSDPDAICIWTTDGQLYDVPYPYDAMFVDCLNLCKAVRFYTNGDHPVSVYASNASGRSANYTTTVYVTDANSAYTMALYPNPATSGYVSLQIRKQDLLPDIEAYSTRNSERYKVELWSEGGLIDTWTSEQPNLQIPLTGLTSGYYYVHVIIDGKRYKQTLIVQ